MKRGVLADTVAAFFGTLGQLEEREARKEDREREQYWKDFIMKRMVESDTRAQESHDQQMERWGVEKEALLREAAARDQFFQEFNLTPEAWAMMEPMKQFEMTKQAHEMAKELHGLNKQMLEIDLDIANRTKDFEVQRVKYLASGAGRGGGAEESTELGALRDEYDQMAQRRTVIEKQIDSHVVRDPTGNPDFSRVPQPLLDARDKLDMSMNELHGRISQLETGSMGLTDFGAVLEDGVPAVPGESAAKTLLNDLVGPSKEDARASRVAEQQASAAERQRLQREGAAIVDETGVWKLSEDPAEIQAAYDRGADNVRHGSQVPVPFLGQPKETLLQVEAERRKPTYGPGSRRSGTGSVGVGAGLF